MIYTKKSLTSLVLFLQRQIEAERFVSSAYARHDVFRARKHERKAEEFEQQLIVVSKQMHSTTYQPTNA